MTPWIKSWGLSQVPHNGLQKRKRTSCLWGAKLKYLFAILPNLWQFGEENTLCSFIVMGLGVIFFLLFCASVGWAAWGSNFAVLTKFGTFLHIIFWNSVPVHPLLSLRDSNYTCIKWPETVPQVRDALSFFCLFFLSFWNFFQVLFLCNV